MPLLRHRLSATVAVHANDLITQIKDIAATPTIPSEDGAEATVPAVVEASPQTHSVEVAVPTAVDPHLGVDQRPVAPIILDGRSLSPSRKFAYVMMHYEGTSKDDEYLLGLRVLIRSIQDTKTPYDIVVITSTNVRESTKQALRADGALLNEVPNLQNPFATKEKGRNSYKSRFVYSFNKLYIWNMTNYERIVFLDSDNIFLTNMDEIFMCGHFCIVYMNPLIFHTGLIVVKPDEQMFKKLINALYADESFSHDGADQGFLVAQFDIEHAPLFLPQQYLLAGGVPSEEPAMRLNIGWNMNHFWYYIAFDWQWFFNGGAGTENEYPWIRAYRATHGQDKSLVAGTSLAYCSGMMLKPWYWFPTMYFDHHYTWHQKRAELGINYWPIFVTRILAFLPLWLVFQYLNNRERIDRITWLDPLRNTTLWLFMKNPVLLGYFYGFGCFLVNGYIVFQLIPYVTPPAMAWSIWIFWHVGLMYINLNLLVNLGLRPSISSQKKSLLLVETKAGQAETEVGNQNANGQDAINKRDIASSAVTGLHAFGLLLLGQTIFFISWLPIYSHFIIKIGAFEYLLMVWIGIQIHTFRRATERMCTPAKYT